MTKKQNTRIPVAFPALYEAHPIKEFQAEGHFVPAIRERDAEGNSTMKPRKWKGATVHCLTLLDASARDPHKTKSQSTARALSDSRDDAEKIFSEQIRNGFYAQLRALEQVEFQADQARRVKDERDRMAAWMAHHHPRELADILGVGEAAVEEYKRSQRDPVLKASVDAMLKGTA